MVSFPEYTFIFSLVAQWRFTYACNTLLGYAFVLALNPFFRPFPSTVYKKNIMFVYNHYII